MIQASIRIRNPDILRLPPIDTTAQRPTAIGIGTIIDISTPAEETLSAKGLDIHGHPVTRLDYSNIGTHLFHHTNHLMPNGYSGYRTWYATMFDMKIARTDTTQSHTYDSVP